MDSAELRKMAKVYETVGFYSAAVYCETKAEEIEKLEEEDGSKI